MRIALVHSFYRSGASGENSVVENQLATLEGIGHQVELVSARSDELIKSWSYEIRAGFRTATGYGANPLSRITKFNPDVVHIHNLFPNWGTTWLSRLKAPLVFQMHNYRSICARGTLFRQGEPCTLCPTSGSHHSVLNSCYQNSPLRSLPLALSTRQPAHDPVMLRANRLIVGSKLALRTLRPFLPAEILAKAEVLPNFLAPRRGKQKLAAVDRTHWVYAGRLVPEKGVEELVTHWPRAEHLTIIGDGPLKEKLVLLSAGKEIRFRGLLTSEQTRNELSKAKGLVFPSVWTEYQPMVYVEALAEGTPTIALMGNSVAEDVLAHSTGIAISHMSEVPKALLSVDASWPSLSEAASIRFNDEYSARVWSKRINNVYGAAIEDFKSKLHEFPDNF